MERTNAAALSTMVLLLALATSSACGDVIQGLYHAYWMTVPLPTQAVVNMLAGKCPSHVMYIFARACVQRCKATQARPQVFLHSPYIQVHAHICLPKQAHPKRYTHTSMYCLSACRACVQSIQFPKEIAITMFTKRGFFVHYFGC